MATLTIVPDGAADRAALGCASDADGRFSTPRAAPKATATSAPTTTNSTRLPLETWCRRRAACRSGTGLAHTGSDGGGMGRPWTGMRFTFARGDYAAWV